MWGGGQEPSLAIPPLYAHALGLAMNLDHNIRPLFNLTVDHGRLDEPGCGANWKLASFEKLENLSSVFQNGLAFLGRIGKASLFEFPEIYDLTKV